MTDKQIEKMKKYVELIAGASWLVGYANGIDDEVLHRRVIALRDCLILRMEREMKR